jgi:hypothetical protein
MGRTRYLSVEVRFDPPANAGGTDFIAALDTLFGADSFRPFFLQQYWRSISIASRHFHLTIPYKVVSPMFLSTSGGDDGHC